MSKSTLDQKRHSLAHLLAAAVMELWPDTKHTIGPVIENGFYYDFEFAKLITEEDLVRIEQKMKQLLPAWSNFEEIKVSAKESKNIFANNPYKLELIEELERAGESITHYQSGNFIDLCRGGHVDKMHDVKDSSWKLDRLAGAYWRGDEKNKMLTRIYGLAFDSKKELAEYLTMIEEAKKRDHRKLGKDLGLFVFSDLIGKGLPTFGPKGATIKRELERFTIDEEIKRDYHHIITPDLAKVDLYKKSGHYPYYKNTMYPVMKIDEEELILKPMTCPHHFMFYKSEPHSYRELPYRIAEIAHQYRYEKSGELSGLTRVRMFCLADAHIITAKDQAKQVIKEVLELIDFINMTLGIKRGIDYRYRLSLGDRSDTKKYYKDDKAWNYAENVLREVLKEIKAPFYEAENEAAFYGPKIDIQMKKISGVEETAFTVQYDFVMPERFDLSFINKEGKEERPIVIHRSSIGCLERTIAFLIEHYGGAFPTWLSPVQIKLLPVGSAHHDFCQKLMPDLVNDGFRVELDDANETIGNKIRKAETEKIPYTLVIGDKEMNSNKLAIRIRGQKNLLMMNKDEFTNRVKQEISTRKNLI
ncbi:MAG: threonine--tRNA ligase [Patescibacteria group bacterium]